MKNVEPFSDLPESTVVDLAQRASTREVPAKEFIFIEGEQGESGYVVVEGRVALIKSSPNGKELIVELLPRGEMFGVVAIIEDRPYPLSARAQVPSVVVGIPRSAVRPLFVKHPGLQQGFFELITNRLRGSHNLARTLAHDRVEARVASVLLAAIPKFADAKGRDFISIGRQELADLCGTTIETASRVTKALEREQVLDLSEQGVVGVKDVGALQALCDADENVM